jgi:hypothetical protein
MEEFTIYKLIPKSWDSNCSTTKGYACHSIGSYDMGIEDF